MPANQTFSLVIFLLKTYFLNPRNNPVFAVFAATIAFFAMEGSLDKYHVALLLYLGVLSHLFVGNLFGTGGGRVSGPDRLPLMRFFQALPIVRKKIYSAYIVSALIYISLFALALGIVLSRLMRLPDIEVIETLRSVGPDGDTTTALRGFFYSARGIPSFVTLTLEKSIFFDLLGRSGAVKLLAGTYYGSVFLYIFVLHAWHRFSRPASSPALGLLHRIPLGFLLLLGVLFAAELILTQMEMSIWTRAIIRHSGGVASAVVGVIVITVWSMMVMSRAIVRELEGTG